MNTQKILNSLDNRFAKFNRCITNKFDTFDETVHETFNDVFRNVISIFYSAEPFTNCFTSFYNIRNNFLNDLSKVKYAGQPFVEFDDCITDRRCYIENVQIKCTENLFEEIKSSIKNTTDDGRDDVKDRKQTFKRSLKFICCFSADNQFLRKFVQTAYNVVNLHDGRRREHLEPSIFDGANYRYETFSCVLERFQKKRTTIFLTHFVDEFTNGFTGLFRLFLQIPIHRDLVFS